MLARPGTRGSDVFAALLRPIAEAGIGGLRVEDNYLVTAGGIEPFSRYPRELTVCPVPG